jgi:hypothetical protein
MEPICKQANGFREAFATHRSVTSMHDSPLLALLIREGQGSVTLLRGKTFKGKSFAQISSLLIPATKQERRPLPIAVSV